MDCAVIFDVDGVLLDLTCEEEDVFFAAFAGLCDPQALSRDWNSYRIRNDDDIVDEIMERHGIAPHLKPRIKEGYLQLLRQHLAAGKAGARAITGARQLLNALNGTARLGIATANLREAARLRLEKAGLWPFVAGHAFGADGGGPKRQILARALARIQLPRDRIVYIGDNLNDVDAGLGNGVHFIGFSENEERLASLRLAGATSLSRSHVQTLGLMRSILGLR